MSNEYLIKELNEKHKQALYYEFKLIIEDEDDVHFILNNGYGLSVSNDDKINREFMLIKEHLGFEQLEQGFYQKAVSKFSSDLKLNCLKLVAYKDWIVRVIKESNDKYLLVTTNTKLDSSNWEKLDNFYIKWVDKTSVMEKI